MKNKKIIIIGVFIFIIIILILYYKNCKFGNNMNKSIDDLKDYILNISSYEATVEVEIISNKNTNKYKIKQWYISPNIFKQEVLEPENIKGLTAIYDGTNLEIQNSRLNLVKIYNEYNDITSNGLSLDGFIEKCRKTEIKCDETEKEVNIHIITEDKPTKYQTLTIDRTTGKPIKMEILDENKNTLVYILYNEITINNTTKEDII